MATPLFRLVCLPSTLAGVDDDFVATIFRDGELALLADETGLEGINAVAHRLGLATVSVVRAEAGAGAQEETVIAYAETLPTVWLSGAFGDATQAWARDRGPMTLLVETSGPLPAAEQRRVERFVSTLGRQTE